MRFILRFTDSQIKIIIFLFLLFLFSCENKTVQAEKRREAFILAFTQEIQLEEKKSEPDQKKLFYLYQQRAHLYQEDGETKKAGKDLEKLSQYQEKENPADNEFYQNIQKEQKEKLSRDAYQKNAYDTMIENYKQYLSEEKKRKAYSGK